MPTTNIEIIGLVGSSIISIAFIPQSYKAIKTKQTNDISFLFIGLNLTASSLMLVYGISTKIIPIIISNTSVFINNFIIAIIKLIYLIKKNQQITPI